MLLNTKIEHHASQILAMDCGNGVAVVQRPNGNLQVVKLDPRMLQIKS